MSDNASAQVPLGREHLWDQLTRPQTWQASPLAYLWGPAGSGKTWLISRLIEHLRGDGVLTVSIDAKTATQDPLLWRQLAHQNNLPVPAAKDVDLSWAVAHFVREISQHQVVYWITDNVDIWPESQQQLLQLAFLVATGPLARIIFSGRMPPSQLWASRHFKDFRMNVFPLSDFSPQESHALVSSWNIPLELPPVEHMIRLSEGRIGLLYAMAQALTAEEESRVLASLGSPSESTAFFLEHLLHPTSRRTAWRGAQSQNPLDRLLAASALLPVVNRDWLSYVVGWDHVNQYWPQLLDLPFWHHYHGGFHSLFRVLREDIRRLTRRDHPWTWEQWTQRSAQYYLGLLRQGRLPFEHCWDVFREFIRPRYGETPFAETETESWEISERRADLEACTVIHIRKNGHVLAEARFQLQSPDHGAVTHAISWDSAALAPLIAHVMRFSAIVPTITWIMEKHEESSYLAELLQAAGFRRTDYAPDCWTLHLTPHNAAEWAQQITAAPRGPIPNHPTEAVQALLSSIANPSADVSPEILNFWRTRAAAGTFRQWFLDALENADLGARISGKTVLTLYHIDRRGTHDQLAELLHMSRATYFRNYREAIQRLAMAVFPTGEY